MDQVLHLIDRRRQYPALSALEAHPLLSALVIAIVARVIYVIYLHPLADVPGPLLAKFSDLWKIRASKSRAYSTRLTALHTRHGDIVRSECAKHLCCAI